MPGFIFVWPSFKHPPQKHIWYIIGQTPINTCQNQHIITKELVNIYKIASFVGLIKRPSKTCWPENEREGGERGKTG